MQPMSPHDATLPQTLGWSVTIVLPANNGGILSASLRMRGRPQNWQTPLDVVRSASQTTAMP
jgi:hypothetical protein